MFHAKMYFQFKDLDTAEAQASWGMIYNLEFYTQQKLPIKILYSEKRIKGYARSQKMFLPCISSQEASGGPAPTKQKSKSRE